MRSINSFELPQLLLSGDFFRHCLKTPLTSLMLNLQLVTADQRVPAETRISLERAQQAAQRLINLLQHYDQTIMVRSHEKAELYFSPTVAIQEVCVFLQQPSLNKIIRFSAGTMLPHVKGNKFLFQEALICLITNAFEAYRMTARTKLVLVSAALVADRLVLQVVDGGRGFNPATTQYCVSDKPAGQGIGWYATRAIIEHEFHGTISVESQPNAGTKITCSLQITDSEPKTAHRFNNK